MYMSQEATDYVQKIETASMYLHLNFDRPVAFLKSNRNREEVALRLKWQQHNQNHTFTSAGIQDAAA